MATIEDVARRAGVSVSTVSYALSGKRPVADETRRRILSIIEELDYRPHTLASRLASKRSWIIGIHYPTETGSLSEGQLELVFKITQAATQKGYSVMLWPRIMRPEEIWKLVRQNLLDGLVLAEVGRHDARVDLLKEKGFPFVMMGRCADNSGLNYVDVDFHSTLRQCVDHLFALGHRHIAFVNASQELIRQEINWVLCAMEGFRQAAADLGIRGEIFTCKSTPRCAYDLVQSIIRQPAYPTGLIMLTDNIAPGVLKAIKDAGLRVPQDISLVTNFMPRAAELGDPPLTGVVHPDEVDIGALAASILIDMLDGKNSGPVQILLNPQLVPRQSSGPRRELGAPSLLLSNTAS